MSLSKELLDYRILIGLKTIFYDGDEVPRSVHHRILKDVNQPELTAARRSAENGKCNGSAQETKTNCLWLAVRRTGLEKVLYHAIH